jgi:ribonuclease VapC
VIVVDTSALMAIVQKEPRAEACKAALETEDEILMSAGTLAELLVVSAGRQVIGEVHQFLGRFDLDIVAVSSGRARLVGAAYQQWGLGFHRAGLNFGDCFAYALAKERGCPLLYVGDDFAKTDVTSVL